MKASALICVNVFRFNDIDRSGMPAGDRFQLFSDAIFYEDVPVNAMFIEQTDHFPKRTRIPLG